MKGSVFASIVLVFALINVLNARTLQSDKIFIDVEVASWAQMRDSNLTKQEYDYSCGAASLSSIFAHYYGLDNASEKEILDWVLLSKGIDINQKEAIQFDGEMKQKAHLSFYDMSEYANSRNFKALGLALDIESLSKLQTPVIVYIVVREVEHFSVLKGMDSQFVYLADPSFGNIKMSRAKFKEAFYPKLRKKGEIDNTQALNRQMFGKIMAILPQDSTSEANAEFMKLQKDSGFVYEVIKDITTR
ncbi:C39 family peptidase [Helicobacter sp. 23-1046]